VKVPLAGEPALGPIKYDPALEPLPDAARAALDRVVRDRAYAEFRLAMLEGAGNETREAGSAEATPPSEAVEYEHRGGRTAES
jgi:hypothetical protein